MPSPLKLIACALALAFAAGPALALEGKVTETTLASRIVPGPVPISIYTPPGYDPKRAQPYPLIIQLHGGGGTNKDMIQRAAMLDKAIAEGRIPPVVSVMPAVGRSFYMDFKDGSQKWETFVTEDLLTYMRKTTDVVQTRKGTFITGISMGGMGSLRIAFKHPELFEAVASQEPGIEPVLAYKDIQLRDRFYRPDALFQQIYGMPVDEAYWALNNPATIASKNPERLVGLQIYLEVGDQDMFFLNQGTEFVHRVLFDAGISHEYRMVQGADHTGPSIEPRFLDAMSYFGRVLNPPNWITPPVLATRETLEAMKRRAGYPVRPIDPKRLHRE